MRINQRLASECRKVPENQGLAGVTERAGLFLVMVFWCALFNYEYETVSSRTFSDTGLDLARLPTAYIILTYLAACLPVAWLPLEFRRPSAVVVWWLYLSVVAPSAFIPFHVLAAPPEQIILLPLTLNVALGFLEFLRRQAPLNLPVITIQPRLYLSGLLVMTAFGLAAIALLHGFNFTVSTDAYEVRLGARETLPSGSGMSYLAATVQRSFGPLLVIVGIANGSRWLIFFGIATLFLAFTLTGEKTLIAIPIMVIGAAIVRKRAINATGIALIALTAVMMVLSILEDLSSGTAIASAYGSRRLLIVPGQLTSYYWDYYAQGDKAVFSAGILGRLLGTATENTLTPAQTIGAVYLGSGANNANANIWAAGFAELGYGGVVLATVLLALILRYLDGLSARIPITAGLAAVLMAPTWADGALHTSLLSQGVLSTLFLVYLAPSENNRPIQRVPAPIRRFVINRSVQGAR